MTHLIVRALRSAATAVTSGASLVMHATLIVSVGRAGERAPRASDRKR